MIFSYCATQGLAQAPGKKDAGGYPAPTTPLERGRTVYVLSSCHFCHGIDLTGAAMGAADLMHSALVGRDENGNLIGPVVRAGLPNLQTAMPQYSDYTDQQIADLAGYIHYLRQEGRYKELTAMKDDRTGDAAAGREYFRSRCRGCHSSKSEIAKKYPAPVILSRLLRPGKDTSPGGVAHLKLLERYSNDDVRNLLAYLTTTEQP